MANRGRMTPDGLALEDWRAARDRFRAATRSNLDGAASVFLGDVEDCYGSIGSATVMGALRRLGLAPPPPALSAPSWRTWNDEGFSDSRLAPMRRPSWPTRYSSWSIERSPVRD